MKKLVSVLLALSVSFFLANFCFAAEHPGTAHEHPGKTHAAEHPGEQAMLSAGQIIQGIKGHIARVTKESGGVFPIHDTKENKHLKLKLVKVHEDKVSYIKKDDAYFACTDFITDDGKTKYDVDFWMKEGKDGKLEVYMTKIHKQDGKPRFTYKDDEIVEVK